MRASDKRERSTIRLTEDATPRTAQPPHRAKLQLRGLSYAGATGALSPQGQYGYEVQRRALSPLEGAGENVALSRLTQKVLETLR